MMMARVARSDTFLPAVDYTEWEVRDVLTIYGMAGFSQGVVGRCVGDRHRDCRRREEGLVFHKRENTKNPIIFSSS